MAKTKCEICGTPCIGCAGGHCKCGLRERQVKVINLIIQSNPEWLDEPQRMRDLISLARKDLSREQIAEAINLGTPIEEVSKPIELTNNLGYCQYPSGSGNKGAWVRCVHCGTERFYGKGKKCEALNKEESTLDTE